MELRYKPKNITLGNPSIKTSQFQLFLLNIISPCSHHTKVLVLPERAIQDITKCDLQTVGEKLAFKNGPVAVLHNLGFVLKLLHKFKNEHALYFE